jgi:hypothetical protein
MLFILSVFIYIFIYLFIYLFNNAVSNSDYIVSNNKMMNW